MDRQNLDELLSVEELESYQRVVQARMSELNAQYGVKPMSEGDREEFADLSTDDEEIDKRLREYDGRVKRLERFAGNGQVEREETFHVRRAEVARGNDIYNLATVPGSWANPEQASHELRERAKRAVEQATPANPLIDADTARGRVERLLERDSRDARFSRYLLATGNPLYKEALVKTLGAQLRGTTPNLNAEERIAMDQAAYAERALSLAGASGGFAIPFELDPTILNTSSGVVNPMRAISRIVNITVDEWRGISSTGVTASYAAEAAETTDNAPTLVQPTISTERAQALIPFSIEVDQDWGGMRDAMGELLQDAKDTLEAAKFINGTGTNEPFGLLVGVTNTVNAATGADAFTLANLYSLVGTLPPRYRQRGVFIGDLLILNRIRQFDTVGSSAAIWQDSLQLDVPGQLLGKPAYEASEMPNDATTGNKFLVFGDFSRYVIVDRIGLNVEVVQHMLGTNRRPTGERALFAYWRNGAKVVDANAFRALLGTI